MIYKIQINKYRKGNNNQFVVQTILYKGNECIRTTQEIMNDSKFFSLMASIHKYDKQIGVIVKEKAYMCKKKYMLEFASKNIGKQISNINMIKNLMYIAEKVQNNYNVNIKNNINNKNNSVQTELFSN